MMDNDEIRALARKTVQKAAADNLNREYNLEPGKEYPAFVDADGTPTGPGVRAYTPSDIDIDQLPMSVDLVQFVIWLRDSTDYFSGPDLDLHFPKATEPDFLEVLGQLAIDYTGE